MAIRFRRYTFDSIQKSLMCAVGCAAFLLAPAFADSITVGAPGDPFNGDCAPFGCAVQYQQVYDASLFPGAVTITGLTFFNHNFLPGSISTAGYKIELSTTAAAVDGLSDIFVENIGADDQLFACGIMGGLIGETNQFTIGAGGLVNLGPACDLVGFAYDPLGGSPFHYDPGAGNLLLTITKEFDPGDFGIFLDFTASAPAGTFSRAYSFTNSGVADAIEVNTGLVTQFTYTPDAAAVPEPSSFLLCLASSLLFALLFARSRRRATVRTTRVRLPALLSIALLAVSGLSAQTPQLCLSGIANPGGYRVYARFYVDPSTAVTVPQDPRISSGNGTETYYSLSERNHVEIVLGAQTWTAVGVAPHIFHNYEVGCIRQSKPS
jgi:hypothetical protein